MATKATTFFITLSLIVLAFTIGCQQQPTEIPSPPEAEAPPAAVETPTGAKFEITSLEVTPKQITAEETVNITAWVENIGDRSGSYEMILYIDGIPIDREWLTMKPGQTRVVTFSLKYKQQPHPAPKLPSGEQPPWGFLLPKQVEEIERYKKAFQDEQGHWKIGDCQVSVGNLSTILVITEIVALE